MPNLKRVKISSERDLKAWLTKHPDQDQTVMVVTCDKSSPTKHISSAQVRDVVTAHGWRAGISYTLNGNLMGHVIRR